MLKFLLSGVSLQQSRSRRSARLGVACVLGALMASCATGASIDDDVLLIARSGDNESGGDPAASEAAGDGVEPSTQDAEVAADAELTPVSGEMSEGPDEDLARGDQPGGGEPSSSVPPDDEPPGDDDSEQVPPAEVPIVDAQPDLDDPDDANPGPDDPGPDDPELGLGPITPPDPVSTLSTEDDAAASDPANPPAATDSILDLVPSLDPATVDPDELSTPVLPAGGRCAAGWEGSSCDVCSGQAQSDQQACRLYIDCYIVNDCDPVSCGRLDEACGVNRLGNGIAPKDIADAVYGCMCAP